MYKIIRSTDKKLIGQKIDASNIEELENYLKELCGSFDTVTEVNNTIILHDSNLLIVAVEC